MIIVALSIAASSSGTLAIRTALGFAACDKQQPAEELAARAAIPISTASRQAAVLRDVGPVTSRRHGSAVLHTIAPLGTSPRAEGEPVQNLHEFMNCM